MTGPPAPWSSSQHYATGVRGTVEIESGSTAFRRGNRLPDGVTWKKVESDKLPSRSSQTTRDERGTAPSVVARKKG